MTILYDPQSGHALRFLEQRPDGRALFEDTSSNNDRVICDPHDLTRHPFRKQKPPLSGRTQVFMRVA